MKPARQFDSLFIWFPCFFIRIEYGRRRWRWFEHGGGGGRGLIQRGWSDKTWKECWVEHKGMHFKRTLLDGQATNKNHGSMNRFYRKCLHHNRSLATRPPSRSSQLQPFTSPWTKCKGSKQRIGSTIGIMTIVLPLRGVLLNIIKLVIISTKAPYIYVRMYVRVV